ncbi:MAG: type II toxin-antitoxin system VapC family toxin [Terriglobales bacterium]
MAPDVSVLIFAYRPDSGGHVDYRGWLERQCVGAEPVGMSELVLAAFVRIVTNPRIFREPNELEEALAYAQALRQAPAAVRLAPGERHWSIFAGLCRAGQARGNLVADAYLAAMAIETGSAWVTTDRDFARFPGLRWRHPLN